MAGFYGRGGPSPMQAPYGRGAVTGDVPQPQPQPAMPPAASSQPSVPPGQHPSPPQSQPSGPQVHCSIPVVSICTIILFEQGHFLVPNTVKFLFSNKNYHPLFNITGPSRADVQNENIRSRKRSEDVSLMNFIFANLTKCINQ